MGKVMAMHLDPPRHGEGPDGSLGNRHSLLRPVVRGEEDPMARTPGQHARAIVRRLRMRTLVTLGVLAVATALLGRGFGWQDPVFLASEVALLVAIFVVCAMCCRSWIATIGGRRGKSAWGRCWRSWARRGGM